MAVKQHLAAVLQDFLEPVRQRRRSWDQRPDELREILAAGTERGRAVVEATLGKVLAAIGLPEVAAVMETH